MLSPSIRHDRRPCRLRCRPLQGAAVACASLWLLLSLPGTAQEPKTPFIPRKQTQPPGPPLSPQAAIDRMTVPAGFRVELVASDAFRTFKLGEASP